MLHLLQCKEVMPQFSIHARCYKQGQPFLYRHCSRNYRVYSRAIIKRLTQHIQNHFQVYDRQQTMYL